ncbi:MAG TPA: restriction endonuclease [Wenzhouxiangellaceae bacterium]|nr:restriction endonuclease [Wenzhouxiangellaceae bacterium]
MARRRRSVIEDILTLVAKAPWPVGVVLAIVSFIVLRTFAQAEPVQADGVSDISATVFSGVGITLATVGQYLVPPLFLVASLGSFLKQSKINGMFQAVAKEPEPGLAKLSWSEFEELVAELFRRRRFTVKRTGKPGPDGGVDVELRRDGKLFLVQCKHWKTRRVTVDKVRALLGVTTARHAAGGFLVTSGKFTEDAESFAKGMNLELIDGHALVEYLGRASESEVWNVPVATPKLDLPSDRGLVCPECGEPMVTRTARRGPTAGTKFWGCSTFPACRGSRPVAD